MTGPADAGTPAPPADATENPRPEARIPQLVALRNHLNIFLSGEKLINVPPVAVVAAETAMSGRLAMRLQAKAYVVDVRFEKEFQTDVFLRGTEALRRHGIKRPPLEWAAPA